MRNIDKLATKVHYLYVEWFFWLQKVNSHA